MPNNTQTPSQNTKKISKILLQKPYIIIISAVLIVLIIIILIAMLVKPKTTSNITNNITPVPTDIKLKFWTVTENIAHFTRLLEDYHKIVPNVTIELETRDQKDYKRILLQRLIENTGTAPDIYEIDQNAFSYYINYLSPAPTDVVDYSLYTNTYTSQIIKDTYFNGSIYGIPSGIDGLMLAYNTQLVNSSEVPTYWPELITSVKQKTQKNDLDSSTNITNGIAIDSSEKTLYLDEIAQLLISQNSITTPYDDYGLVNTDPKLGSDALNILKRLLENIPWDTKENNSLEAFANGHTAYAFIKAKDILTIQKQNPNLKFKTTVMPIISPQIYSTSYTAYVVSNQSMYSKEAWAFLKYISSEKSVKYLYDSAVINGLPRKPYAIKSLLPELKSEELIAPIGTMAPNMISWPSVDPEQTKVAWYSFLTSASSGFTPENITNLNDNLNRISPKY